MDLDLPTQFGAVTREVLERDHEGTPHRLVVATRSYPAPVDDVWDALTNPERIPRWFLPVSGDLRLGGRYQLEGNAGGTITGCKPPRHLAVTWEFGGQVSWLEVHLDEDGDGATTLRLEHLVPTDDHWRRYGPGAVGIGWDLTLLGLADHLAGAERPDVELATRPEGLDYMRRSGDAWRDAHLAAGIDPEDDVHRQAAAATAAFTGEAGPEGPGDGSTGGAEGADSPDASGAPGGA
ncbi:MAG TPA: SRPBCC family protein [Acidimicrobiales bacterium]